MRFARNAQLRARIYRWYKQLRSIDEQLRRADSPDDLERATERLRRLDDEIQHVTVPLSYMSEFYNLRQHVDLVAERVERQARRLKPDDPPPKTIV